MGSDQAVLKVNDFVITPWLNRWSLPSAGVITKINKDQVHVNVYNALGPGADKEIIFKLNEIRLDNQL